MKDDLTYIGFTPAQCEIYKKIFEYEFEFEQIFKIRGGQAVLDFDSSGKMKASVKYPIKKSCG